MRRRALLTSIAASTLTLTAGCSGDDTGTPTAEPTPTASPSDDSTPTEGQRTHHSAQVSVGETHLQRGYVVREVADAIGVVGDDRRHLWVDVSVTAGAFAPDAFSLTVGDAEYDPLVDHRSYWLQRSDRSAYTLQSGEGLLLFELPLSVEGDPPTTALTWPSGQETLPATVASRLTSEPAPVSVSLAANYDASAVRPLEIAVTNEGERPRRFVGALNREGPDVAVAPIRRVAVDVAAGETTTILVEDDLSGHTPTGEDGPAVEYKLNWAGDSATATIDALD